jgi:hypothetical protein
MGIVGLLEGVGKLCKRHTWISGASRLHVLVRVTGRH